MINWRNFYSLFSPKNYVMTTQEAVMTTQDVANRFNELAQTGQWQQIQDELFADDALSVEPAHSPGLKTVQGREAISQKRKAIPGNGGRNAWRLYRCAAGGGQFFCRGHGHGLHHERTGKNEDG